MMKIVPIHVDPGVEGNFNAGLLEFDNLKCQKFNNTLWREVEKLAEQLKIKYETPSSALTELKPARDLYRTFGMEPTRIRPSSEALLRRVIKNKKLYQINSIVDVSNLASLSFLLPVGLYDVDKIEGPVVIRLGEKNQEYEGIRKDFVHVENRLTLSDNSGPFGNPSSDSFRTSVDMNTTHVLVIVFAPDYYPQNQLNEHCEYLRRLMLNFHPSGNCIREEIIADQKSK